MQLMSVKGNFLVTRQFQDAMRSVPCSQSHLFFKAIALYFGMILQTVTIDFVVIRNTRGIKEVIPFI